MNAKSILFSKTLWVNVAMVVLIILNQQIPLLNLDAEAQAVLVGAVNLLLRLITKQPVTVLPK